MAEPFWSKESRRIKNVIKKPQYICLENSQGRWIGKLEVSVRFRYGVVNTLREIRKINRRPYLFDFSHDKYSQHFMPCVTYKGWPHMLYHNKVYGWYILTHEEIK